LPEPGQECRSTFEGPRTSIERTIARIWEELLGLTSVGVSDNFFDLGGHSLLAIQLIARLEKTFGKTLPVAVLFQSPTVEQLARLFTDEPRAASWSSLIPVQEAGSKLPFFWVHGDSSTAVLPKYLGGDQPLYAFEHQAHDGKAAVHTRVETIATHYLAELRTLRPHGPYLLGGYSFGAVTAFEMAQQLASEGEEVPLLFMLDPPGKMTEPAPPAIDRRHEHFRELALLPPRETLGYLVRRLKTFAQTRIVQRRAAIGNHLARLRWNTHLVRGNLLPPPLRSPYILDIYRRALRFYTPQRYSGRALIFKCGRMPYRPTMDWIHLTSGEIQTYEGAGGHAELTKEPCVSVWAVWLKESLESVAADAMQSAP